MKSWGRKVMWSPFQRVKIPVVTLFAVTLMMSPYGAGNFSYFRPIVFNRNGQAEPQIFKRGDEHGEGI
jgi:hypothetical protein